jgi:hypothetical protein
MRPPHFPSLGVRATLGLLAVALAVAPAVARQGKRYAVLVGPKRYNHSKFTVLEYTENDVTELAGLLRGDRYEVALLTDASGRNDRRFVPTKANIQARLKEVLDKCQREDLVLVAFSGHGLQFDNDPDCYFCPRDARPFADETKTLISLDAVYKQLGRCGAGAKVLLADCCRIDPAAGRARLASVPLDDILGKTPPQGGFAFFSCSKGERAFEHQELKHGVFFHHVIQGLKQDVNDPDGEVKLEALTTHVRKRVPAEVRRLFGGGVRQAPQPQGHGRVRRPPGALPPGGQGACGQGACGQGSCRGHCCRGADHQLWKIIAGLPQKGGPRAGQALAARGRRWFSPRTDPLRDGL